ncbi:MAG TPA: 50S ribosomal protein L18 [Phycisphaerae bacterium]|nr:50S ribosomal protein L18 [Phycisphaerae bacterium]
MNDKNRKAIGLSRRKKRVRGKLLGTPERPRLTVSRSHKNISAQIIDDLAGRTLCAASTSQTDVAEGLKYGGNCAAATRVGQKLAERARMQGIRAVAFDRNGLRYHGRIKALADAARKSGLEF